MLGNCIIVTVVRCGLLSACYPSVLITLTGVEGGEKVFIFSLFIHFSIHEMSAEDMGYFARAGIVYRGLSEGILLFVKSGDECIVS